MANPKTPPTRLTRPTDPVGCASPTPKPESKPQSQDAEQAKEGASTGDLGGST